MTSKKSKASHNLMHKVSSVPRTWAGDLLAMSRTTFLHNARTRLPFAGVAEFYRSLQPGRNGKRNNLYLSAGYIS